jgi:putative addiction module killer protein
MGVVRIINYKTKTGKTPVLKWISDELDIVTQSIVITRIRRLTLGNFGDCKLLKQAEGLWELRIAYGPGYRIYFGRIGHEIVVLLVGGDKGSQERDITKAKQYWLDYKRSKNGTKKENNKKNKS